MWIGLAPVLIIAGPVALPAPQAPAVARRDIELNSDLANEVKSDLTIELNRIAATASGERRIPVPQTSRLFAADQIELCFSSAAGFVTLWSMTDTRIVRLWAGQVGGEDHGPGGSSVRKCINADGDRKLWIQYGGEETEFAVFWSALAQDMLSADAFNSSGVSALAASEKALSGLVAQTSGVWEVVDGPRGADE